MAQKSSHAARKKGGVWKILLVLVVLLSYLIIFLSFGFMHLF